VIQAVRLGQDVAESDVIVALRYANRRIVMAGILMIVGPLLVILAVWAK
jgi:hypothetical protein